MKNTQIDEKGDFLFRFALRTSGENAPLSLDEFYRRQILDLARLVQFHFRGEPVQIDSFAFRNRPDEVIAILPGRVEKEAAE